MQTGVIDSNKMGTVGEYGGWAGVPLWSPVWEMHAPVWEMHLSRYYTHP